MEGLRDSSGKLKLGAFKTAASLVVKDIRSGRYRYVDQNHKVAGRIKAAYAAPQLSLTSLTLFINVFAITFYANLGLSLSFISFLTAVARSFDVLTDPLMAWISDNTKFKMGRRRPYMRFFSWGYALSFFLFLYPPSRVEDETKAEYVSSLQVWYSIFYVAFYAFDTIANVPYTALGPELSDDYDERSSVFFFQKLVGNFGTLLGAALPGVLVEATGDIRLSYAGLAAGFGIYYFFAVQWLVSSVKERPGNEDRETIPLIPSILRSFKNRAFRPLLFAWVLDYVAVSAISTMLPFFITYIIRPSSVSAEFLLSLALGTLLLAAVVGMPFWLWLASKIGKRNAWLTYNLVNATTGLWFLVVGEGDVALLMVGAILNGIPVGGQFLIESVLADVIDYDEFLNGTRNEGSFTVFATFIPKVVSIPAQAVPLALITAAGFIAPVNEQPILEQPATVLTFIRIVYIFLPTSAMVVSFLLKLQFPIKSRKDADMIAEGINAHLNHLPAFDPITGRDVSLLKVTPEEQQQVWVLDNFSTNALETIIKKGGETYFLAWRMGFLVFASVVYAVAFGSLVYVYLPFIDEPALSWIPPLSVIALGMSIVCAFFNIRRLQSAIKIRSMNLSTDLVLRIVNHKGKGQRGGDPIPETQMTEHDKEVDEALKVIRMSWMGAVGPTGVLNLASPTSPLTADK